MDLSTFNKNLKQLVNRARKQEVSENFEDAKEAWIDVAEFTIHFYKHTNLEPSFKNMLINKTEGIIQHVKKLDKKIRMSGALSELSQEQEEKSEEPTRKPSPQDKNIEEQVEDKMEQETGTQSGDNVRRKNSVGSAQQEMIREKSNLSDEITGESKPTELPSAPSKPPQKEPEIVENSEFKNVPEGFKEIKAPRDFEVITPHDKEEIEKRLSISGDMSVFKYENEEDTPKSEKTVEKADEPMEHKTERKEEPIICFACGEKNAPGTKVCSNCGTELE